MYAQAAERSLWAPQNCPQDRTSDWRDNHQILFDNANLHPNYRSYFDRGRERRSPVAEELPGALKPAWRLSNAPVVSDEREIGRKLQAPACCVMKPHKPVDVLRISGPFEAKPPSLRDADAPGAEPRAKSPKSQALLSTVSLEGDIPSHAVSKAESPKKQPSPAEEHSLMIRSSSAPSVPTECGDPWDDRHYVTWCNERHTQGAALNPVLMRSYFDRMRYPHHSRCQQIVRAQRTVPEWKLRTDPMTGEDLGPRSTDATYGSGGSISTALDVLKAPTRQTPENLTREHGWNARHQLVFKNEEVSRLDRNYFDRWREPECNLFTDETVRSFKPTWALAREGAPDKNIEVGANTSASRHVPCGDWDPRHTRMFYNKIHQNSKSYFGRMREPEDMNESRQRKKITDKDKLKINWSLQEYLEYGSDHHAATLRTESGSSASASAKDLGDFQSMMSERPKTGSRQHTKPKKRQDWFSNHGVVF